MKGIFTNKRANYIFLLTIVVTVLLGCGAVQNNAAVTNHTGSALKNSEEIETEETVEEPANQELYIVEDLNMADETISLYSISEAKQYRYNYTMTTKFLDKYGKASMWAEFTIGSVVTIDGFLPSSGALMQVQKSDDVWVYEDLSKYTIDTEKNLIKINGSNYKITGSTKAYSDTEKILVNSIGSDDILTVVGQDKDIISIAVTTGHGFIHLTNTELFDDSMIFIGNKIVSMVNGDEVIEVPEGTYKITVANNGWGGSGDYTVVRNETTEINLDDLKGDGPSYCLITFLVTAPDTYVYIDGEQIDVTEPQYVQYGNHSLRVDCAGYNSWNKTLVVNSAEATITLALESESGETVSEPWTEEPEEEEAEEESESESEEPSNSEDYDYEVDYLTTIADLLGTLNN